MCVVFFYDFMWSFIIFLKIIYACHFFFSNLDFVEPLGVFAVICSLTECLAFGMLIYMCRSCFLKLFITKFHSKPFFRNCFMMLPFLTACWWFYTLLEIVIVFGVIWFILAQFWLWHCILDIIKILSNIYFF